MKVALAIASFRQNDAVYALLEHVHKELKEFFSHVIVVESMGDGGVQAFVNDRGYDVQVVNAPENLGSAGNLALRMELAAQTDADWLYAINHDGELTRVALHAFRHAAQELPHAGALYPLRRVPMREKIDMTGTQRLPLPFRGAQSMDELDAFTRVRWGSSNVAYYNLSPIRAGLCAPAHFWMGWEDLAYGYALDEHNWPQYVVRDAMFIDDREYLTRYVFGKKLTVSDKPSWYAYYFARNFILVGKEKTRTWDERATIAARIGLEIAVTTVFKPKPIERLTYMAKGIKDGLVGKNGKWKFPQ